jgi:glycosyltransferase involved in cell wall biosynthesis
VRRRVLVLTRDPIPLPGMTVSGGGLRAWGLGEALRAKGHEVLYSVPRNLVPDGDQFDELRSIAFEPDELHRTLLKAEPDVVLVEQWGLATYLQDPTVPVVLDLHGSLILENAFRRHRTLTSNAAAKIKALQKADLVICPALRQRAYFMAWLMMSGAEPTSIPIEVVPVSMPPELPARTADYEGPLSLVYGGQLWPWIEPTVALTAAAEALGEDGGTCHLFVGEPRAANVLPYDSSSEIWTRPLREELRAHGAIKLEGLVPREQLLARYAASHLAVDVYAWNTERELAYTTRTVEYLWCGLPVLYADYGELAGLIREYGAGWVVAPDDGDAMRAAVRQAMEDRSELERRSENAQRLVQERLTWDRTVAPLDQFVRDPVVREKGTTIFGKLALEFDRIDNEMKTRVLTLEAQIAELDREQRRLGREVEARESRIGELQLELSRQDRRLTEQAERYGREAAAWDRERRGYDETVARLEAEVAGTKEMLGCEQDAHSQASARLEMSKSELAVVERRLEDRDAEIKGLRADLKGAVERISTERGRAEARIEGLERQLREVSQRELELRSDLAGEVARAEGLRDEAARGEKQVERLRAQVASQEQVLGKLKDHWLQRTVATGQHSLRRVTSQVPALAGLFVRNLANNAYMTIWQRRAGVRIFPGQ